MHISAVFYRYFNSKNIPVQPLLLNLQAYAAYCRAGLHLPKNDAGIYFSKKHVCSNYQRASVYSKSCLNTALPIKAHK